MIDLAQFKDDLTKRLNAMTAEEIDAIINPPVVLIDYNKCVYCKDNAETGCGKCHCGKVGHIRSILFFTSIYCPECYERLSKQHEIV